MGHEYQALLLVNIGMQKEQGSRGAGEQEGLHDFQQRVLGAKVQNTVTLRRPQLNPLPSLQSLTLKSQSLHTFNQFILSRPKIYAHL